MVPALKLTAESIGRGPQSVRFHVYGEIPPGTIDHLDNESLAFFFHCNLFLCLEMHLAILTSMRVSLHRERE